MKSKTGIAVRVMSLSRDLGVDQETLAALMRVSPSTVRGWTSGEHRPLRAHLECRIRPLSALAAELKLLLNTKKDAKTFLNTRCKKAHRSPLQILKRNRYIFEKPETVDRKLHWVFDRKTISRL